MLLLILILISCLCIFQYLYYSYDKSIKLEKSIKLKKETYLNYKNRLIFIESFKLISNKIKKKILDLKLKLKINSIENYKNNKIENFKSIASSTMELSADKCTWAKNDLNKTIDNLLKIINIKNFSIKYIIEVIPSILLTINVLVMLIVRCGIVCTLPKELSNYFYDFTIFIKDISVSVSNLYTKMLDIETYNKTYPCDLDTDCKGFMTGEKCCQRKCLNTGNKSCPYSEVGEACKLASDCKDWGVLKKNITCCKENGYDKNPLKLREWGVCTKPCINTGIGWCPATAKNKKITCEKPLGAKCNASTDCSGWGWGIGGKGVSCCQGICKDVKGKCKPSELGEGCKIATDCKNFGGSDKIVCCKEDGTDNPIDKWGVCTKPCINTGIGWCPKTAKDKKITCEKPLGAKCNASTDCSGWGWGVGGKGVSCCQGICKDVKGKCKPSELGEGCKIATDCKNFGGSDKIVCCKEDGTDNPIDKWGVCTKPCVNGAIGWCPKTAKDKKITCEKPLGAQCNIDTDCSGWGWGVGGVGNKCCANKCSKNNQGNVGSKCNSKKDCCNRDCKPKSLICPGGNWYGKVNGQNKICCKNILGGQPNYKDCVNNENICW